MPSMDESQSVGTGPVGTGPVEARPVKHVRKQAYLLAVLRQDPFELFRLLRIAWTTAKYRYLVRCAGKGTVIGTNTEIINAANVTIGQNCLLQDSVYLRAGAQGRITLGDRAALNSFCRIFGHGGVEIGADAQVGPGTLITTTDHDVLHNLEASFKPVKIGRRAWIGANVTVLPGVTIGEYAVVGAGSVVTKDIPPRSLAVGVPARVIRELPSAHPPGGEPEAAAQAVLEAQEAAK